MTGENPNMVGWRLKQLEEWRMESAKQLARLHDALHRIETAQATKAQVEAALHQQRNMVFSTGAKVLSSAGVAAVLANALAFWLR